jgi:pimeloyl-ACP methyl ester carboxylesterase
MPILSGLGASATRRIVQSMTTDLVRVDNCDIHLEAAGEGPAVLFIHAGVADSRMWRDQMGLPGHRTITFDQRGFGKTQWVPGSYSNRGDALAILDHLDVDTAVVVGCSNGGEAAMQLALVAPDRVLGLVLVGTAPGGWEPDGGWADDPLWDQAVAASKTGDMDRVVDLDAQMWLAGPGRALEEVDTGLVDLFRIMDRVPAATESEREPYVETLEPPTNEQLDAIAQPTLAVVGEHDYPDLVIAASYLAQRLSDRAPVVLNHTAHLPSLEVPDAFNNALTGFLTSI